MSTNILKAIKNIIESPVFDLKNSSKSSNRINSVGESLEEFIKDLFSNSLNMEKEADKIVAHSEVFSYSGGKNNPPDFMIKGGDAVEVKKIESSSPSIALNSSYPKSKLYSNDPMITTDCKKCEEWEVKDILYAIGTMKKSALKSLWFVYGDCYAADNEIYQKLKDKISDSLNNIPDIDFSETKELGRVNRVDPLGITYLRIRGMWHIEHPNKVFKYLNTKNESDFNLNSLILEDKYNSFPELDRLNLEKISNPNFSIEDVQIKSPNNPAKLLKAKLITFSI